MKNENSDTVPEFYFDARGGYWRRVASNRFLNLGASDMRLHLQVAGLDSGRSDKDVSEVNKALYVAQLERAVDYAGPLGGHRVGRFETTGGKRVLVTSEPNGVFEKPTAKPHVSKWFDTFLSELLGEQLDYFLAWLKIGLSSLRCGSFQPGQMVVFAGPKLCGKSLLQSIVTELFGGRAAMPFNYMVGKTNFNSDLAQAEHWMIEDQSSATDIVSRRQFSARIKEATVNRDFYLHAKGKEAVCLPIFRRITLSVNDEPENLMIIPPMDESLRDKLILFQCGRASLEEADRKETWEEVKNGLPGFVAFLAQWRPPKRIMGDSRFGVTAYHHPELLHALSSMSPEIRMLELMDEVFWNDKADVWAPVVATATEIEQRLRRSSFATAVHVLLGYSSACGVYLARLAARQDGRVKASLTNGRTRWTIEPPAR